MHASCCDPSDGFCACQDIAEAWKRGMKRAATIVMSPIGFPTKSQLAIQKETAQLILDAAECGEGNGAEEDA